MEIFLLIAALCCAAASVAAALSLARCLREAMEAQRAPVPPAAQEELRERALREQRRFEEALSGILAYGLDDMRRRPGEEA